MNQSVRSQALPGSHDPVDDLESNIKLSGFDAFDWLWHLFISMRTGLVLILALAVLNLIGTMLVQAPDGMLADRSAYTAWLDSVARPKYGGWTVVLDALGFFSIFSSIIFRSIAVLLSASILACSVNRAPRLWRQAVHPRTVMTGSFFEHAAMHAAAPVTRDLATSASTVEAALRKRGFRTIVTRAEDEVEIFADRFRWGPFGTVIAHLSILLILVGVVLGAGGFRDTEFAASVGSTVDVGHNTGLSVKATSFNDSYYANGSPSDYASNLVLFKDGRQVAEQTIRVNQPLRYGDVTFYQSFFGPAADMAIRDTTGKMVFEGGVPLRWNSQDGTKALGSLDIPGTGYTAWVIGAASGKVDPTIGAGQMQLEVYGPSDPNTALAIQVVDQGKPVTVEGLEFTFVREHQFTGLIVARDPGAGLVWAGSAALVLGVALVFFFPYRRIWARVRRGDAGSLIEVAAITRHDTMFETAFAKLVHDVKLALSGADVS